MDNTTQRPVIINVGARYNRAHPERKGGVVVLFEQWLDFCGGKEAAAQADFLTIDSNKRNYPTMVGGYFTILRQLRRALKANKGRKLTVMLHGTYFDYIWVAPIALRMARKAGAKLVLRKFAGNFRELYEGANGLLRRNFDHVLRGAALTFWESKKLVEFGSGFNQRNIWFPNVRQRPDVSRPEGKPYGRRFVFLSRVEKQKGVRLLAEVFAQLPSDYSLDIYGPIFDDTKPEQLCGENFHYRGPVSPDKVPETLAKYDVLLLPTTWNTEGYPGIIIEAFAAGLPVMASKIGGIPEMVADGHNGLLLPAGDAEALRNAVLRLTPEDFATMSRHARESFATYDASRVNPHILQQVLALWATTGKE